MLRCDIEPYTYIHNRMSNVKKNYPYPSSHDWFYVRDMLCFSAVETKFLVITSSLQQPELNAFGFWGVWKWTSVRFVRGRLITQILCRDNGAMLNVMCVQWIRHCQKRFKMATDTEQTFIEAGHIQVTTEIVKTEHNLTFLKVRRYDRMFTTIWTTIAWFCSCWLIRREKWHLKFWFELQLGSSYC
jgi:hypothetical protein